MRLSDCHNIQDFRRLARKRLPGPVFHYIVGAAADELTKARNTRAFDDVDLVPNVLAGVAEVDMSVTVLGRKLAMPLFLSPTALQRLFHWEGERAVGRAASAFGTYFGAVSYTHLDVYKRQLSTCPLPPSWPRVWCRIWGSRSAPRLLSAVTS